MSTARHPRRIEPGPGQESVWDYPRPPLLQPSDRLVVVRLGDREIARTTGAFRVLETSHPPTWYLPPTALTAGSVERARGTGSVCEWKGAATYWDVLGGDGTVLRQVGWSYEHPTAPFRAITGYLSFYPGRLDCTIDGERVRPQEGGFYGGWVTDEIVGPFKGGRGQLGVVILHRSRFTWRAGKAHATLRNRTPPAWYEFRAENDSHPKMSIRHRSRLVEQPFNARDLLIC